MCLHLGQVADVHRPTIDLLVGRISDVECAVVPNAESVRGPDGRQVAECGDEFAVRIPQLHARSTVFGDEHRAGRIDVHIQRPAIRIWVHRPPVAARTIGSQPAHGTDTAPILSPHVHDAVLADANAERLQPGSEGDLTYHVALLGPDLHAILAGNVHRPVQSHIHVLSVDDRVGDGRAYPAS